MPRPARKGLSYYPRDIDHMEDDRIFMLVDRYGPLGYMVYDMILSIVYRDGYYIEIDCERLTNRVIRAIGNRWIKNRRQVHDIICYIADIGLINRDLLDREGVVTSEAIQRCYAEVASRRVYKNREYWLLDGEDNAAQITPDLSDGEVSAAETPLFQPESVVTASETPDMEEAQDDSAYSGNTKKSKENKTKENQIKQNTTALPAVGQSGDELSGEAYSMFCSLIRTPKPAERLKLEKLCDRYGQAQVVAAIKEASLRGGRSAAYVESILRSCCEPEPAGSTEEADHLPGDRVVNGMYTHIRTPEELQELYDLMDEELYAEFYASESSSGEF